MGKKIDIGGELQSVATDHKVVDASQVKDSNNDDKTQEQINTETYNYVENINAALASLSPEQIEALSVAEKANSNTTRIGYYICDTNANTAAKAFSAVGYILTAGGSMKVLMSNVNSANDATLNINSTGAKPLFYNGARASSLNTWDAGEVLDIYYDGTNYQAHNVAGGSGDGILDVSKKYPTYGVNGGNTYTLELALTVLNTYLPTNKKEGGMSIRFVSSSDNKYVQYRLKSRTFSSVTSNWQGVDVSPTPNSPNLVESGGAFKMCGTTIFDVSEYKKTDNGLAEFYNIQEAIGPSYSNIPESIRHGGIIIRFVNSSTHKYEQWRSITKELSLVESNWQSLKGAIEENNHNIPEAGTIYTAIENAKAEVIGSLPSFGFVQDAYANKWKRIFTPVEERKTGCGFTGSTWVTGISELIFTEFYICSDCKKILLKTVGSAIYNSITFFNESGEYISSYKDATGNRYIVVDVPTNAYIVAILGVNDEAFNYKGFSVLIEDESLINNGQFGTVTINAETNKASVNKNHLQSNDWSVAVFYIEQSVKAGDIYKVSANTTGLSNRNVLTFTDDEYNVILTYTATTVLSNIVNAVPYGATKLIIQSRKNNKLWLEYLGHCDNYYSLKQLCNNYGRIYKETGYEDNQNMRSTDYIRISTEKIYATTLPSSVVSTIYFFDKAKHYISASSITGNPYLVSEVEVPKYAKYIIINAYKNSMDNGCVFVDGEFYTEIYGRQGAANIKTSTSTIIKLFDKDTIPDYPVSMGGNLWVDGNYVYCTCGKRVTTNDYGLDNVAFVKYDMANSQFIYKKLVFEGGTEVGEKKYGNNAVYVDSQNIFGTTNRVYVFSSVAVIGQDQGYITSQDGQDFVYKYSDDGGDTWSEEISLKQYWENMPVFSYRCSVSPPIITSDGTFVMPAQATLNLRETGNIRYRSGFITYKDGQWSFKIADVEGSAGDNECSVIEYGRNAIMLNCRNFKDTRSVYSTSLISDNPSVFIHPSNKTFFVYNDYGCTGCLARYGNYYLFFYINNYNKGNIYGTTRDLPTIFLSEDLCNFFPVLTLKKNVYQGCGNIQVANSHVYVAFEDGPQRYDIDFMDITDEIDEAIQKYANCLKYNDVINFPYI